MAVVGSAYVVVRAISNKLADDIKSSVEDAAKQAAPAARRVGDAVGDGIRDQVRTRLRDDLPGEGERGGDDTGQRFSQRFLRSLQQGLRGVGNALRRPFQNSDKDGNSVATRFVKGFMDGINKIPALPLVALLGLPALGGAINAVAYYASSLVSIVGALGPAMAGAAAAYGVGITAILQGTLALKLAFTKIGKEGTPAFQALTKQATAFRDELAKSVQGAALPRFSSALKTLSKDLLPTLKSQLRDTGKVLGDTAKGFADMLTSAGNAGRIKTLMAGNNAILSSLGKAATSVGDAFIHIAVAAQPMVKTFANFISVQAKVFDNFIKTKSASGDLADFFGRAAGQLQQLGKILADFGVGIFNVFKAAAPAGGVFLSNIEAMAAKFREFTGSVQGQAKLSKFFQDAIPVVQELNGLIGDIGKIWASSFTGGNTDKTVAFIQTLRTDMVPALKQMYDAIKESGPSLTDLATSFANLLTSLSNSGALGTFTSTLKTLLDVLNTLMGIPVVGTVVGWGLAFAGMAKAINTVTFGAFGKGLVAATKGISNLFTVTEEGSSVMGRFGARVSAAASSAFDTLRLRAMYARDAMANFAQSMGRGIQSGFQALQAGASRAAGAMSSFASAMGTRLQAGFAAIQAGAARAGQAIISMGAAIGRGASAGFSALAAAAGRAASALGTAASAAMSASKAALISAAGWVRQTAAMVAGRVAAIAMSVATRAMAVAQGILNAIMAVNPFVLIIAALVALGAGLVLLYKKSETFRNIISSVFKVVRTIVEGAIDGIKAAIQGLVAFFTTVGKFIYNWILWPYRMAFNIIKAVITGIINFITSNWDTIVTVFQTIGKVIFYWITWPYQAAKLLITTVIPAIFNFISSNWGKIVGFFTTIGSAILNAITLPFRMAWQGIVAVAGAIVSFVSGIPGRIVAVLKPIVSFVTNIFRTAFTTAFNAARAVWNAIYGFVTGIPGRIYAGLVRIISIVGNIFRTAWNNAYTTLRGIASAIIGFVAGLPGRAGAALGALISHVTAPFRAAFSAARNAVITGWNAVSSFIRSIPGKIGGFLAGVGSAVMAPFRSAFNAVKNFISSVINGIKSSINTVIGAIESVVNAPFNALRSALSAIGNIGFKVGGQKIGVGPIHYTLPTVSFHLPDFSGSVPGPWHFPRLAEGGTIDPVVGGMLALLGEAGRAERVTPLNDSGMSAFEEEILNRQANPPVVQVRVFIGNQELTDIVDTQVSINNGTLAAAVSTGRRSVL